MTMTTYKGVFNCFPHTTNLQQYFQKFSNSSDADFLHGTTIIEVAEGDIAHYVQFLLLLKVFQKSSAAEASESVFIWKMVKTY